VVGKYKGNGSTKFRTTLEYVLAISHDTEPTYETVTFIVSGSRECITQFLPTYSRVTLITLYIYIWKFYFRVRRSGNIIERLLRFEQDTGVGELFEITRHVDTPKGARPPLNRT